jgi:hydroxyacylglutathione hydrolase
MIVQRLFEPMLAQASYLVGCAFAGEAIVIDPNRDADAYLAAAAAENLRITHVTETHIHADYLSGSRELAHKTGATLWLSDEGDAGWKYQFISEGRPIRGGGRITIGNVSLDVVHTPGHTPEHVTFLVTDGAVADQPIAAVTGDFIFVGDVGRPDLLERAVRMSGTMEDAARTLYASLQAFNRDHPEWLQIWPGHGAGSSCGKGISAVPHSTLGYERRFNWAFNVESEEAFVQQVLAGQPDPPKYFATMKRLNQTGPRLLQRMATPSRVDDCQLWRLLGRGGLVIDTRSADAFAAGFVPGTINLPLNNAFLTWAGWLIPYDTDIYLLLGEGGEARLDQMVRALALIGIDHVAGYFASSAIGNTTTLIPLARIPQIDAQQLAGMRGDHTPVVIDVRNDNEWAAGHLPAAVHIPLGHISDRLSHVPKGQPLITQCQAGARSAIAASVLRRAGFTDVSNLVGGYGAWVAAGLPVVR